MTDPPPFSPQTEYRPGDLVSDYRADKNHIEPGGIFEAIAHFRSGLLDPRYVAIDCPDAYWRRIEGT